MKLHSDKEAFRVLIENVYKTTGYREDVLEKDYYVVLLLSELADMQKNGLPAYFKGGTALYKALKITNRFSEDIDLSVEVRDCSRTQGDKRLEQATKKYTKLQRDISLGKTNRSEIISFYTYEPIVMYDIDDRLQRFGKLKIEATSFTISEPTEKMEVSTMLYDYASKEEKQILENVYDVKPFSVLTITLERIFIDKLFAAEAYVRRSKEGNRAFEAAKHIYDLSVLARQPQILKLLSNENDMKKLLDIRMEEETQRRDGIPGVTPIEFVFFTQAAQNDEVRKAYEIMQNQYVFRECDKIEFSTAMSSLIDIHERLSNNIAWVQCEKLLPEDEKQSVRITINTIRKEQNNSSDKPKEKNKNNEPER